MQDPNPFLGDMLVLLGALGVLAGLAGLCFPGAARAGLSAFPRSRWPGWILTAVGVGWVSWVTAHAALGRFEGVKPWIPVLSVASYFAIVYFLDELLAPRSLGGLLLLLADPLLDGVRWADSAWRFVVVLIAYAWVIAGCGLMLHPWLFRKMAERVLGAAGRLRAICWAKVVGGGVLLAAGLWTLR